MELPSLVKRKSRKSSSDSGSDSPNLKARKEEKELEEEETNAETKFDLSFCISCRDSPFFLFILWLLTLLWSISVFLPTWYKTCQLHYRVTKPYFVFKHILDIVL